MAKRKGPEWRQATPEDFCWNCRRIGATRMIFIKGDRDWIESALALALDHDDDVIEGITDAAMAIPEYEPGRVFLPVQLCRLCADQARQRFINKGTMPPAIYNAAKWLNGDYKGETLIGHDQPPNRDHVPMELVEHALLTLIEERLHDPELHAMFAKEGVTLCRHWMEEDQEWGYYVTSNPELIAEDAILPKDDAA